VVFGLIEDWIPIVRRLLDEDHGEETR